MALTKVRSPVTDISLMSLGTTDITIASAGGPIDIDVAGNNIVDYTSTTAIFDPTVTVTAKDLETEVLTVDTSAGANAVLQTTGTEGSLETTTAHPLELGANSILGMTIETDGKTTLEVEGTAIGHLVTKAYVDNAATTNSIQLSDMVSNSVINGSVQIHNSSGNDLILNWGVTASITGLLSVVFDTAFVSSFFAGGATRQIASTGADATANINNTSTTGMDVINTGSATSPVHWWAIGE